MLLTLPQDSVAQSHQKNIEREKDHPKVAALRLLPLSLRHDLSQDRELGVQSDGYASWHSGSEALATYGKHAV